MFTQSIAQLQIESRPPGSCPLHPLPAWFLQSTSHFEATVRQREKLGKFVVSKVGSISYKSGTGPECGKSRWDSHLLGPWTSDEEADALSVCVGETGALSPASSFLIQAEESADGEMTAVGSWKGSWKEQRKYHAPPQWNWSSMTLPCQYHSALVKVQPDLSSSNPLAKLCC